jgi:2-dehydro-3-deoxyphosphogluconate aldolase/(4S)-4-hydroxy-2-oxoglutarate aldolase
MNIRALLQRAPVIPVIRIDERAAAVPVGQALVDGGLPVLEVTLRTPVALEAIRDLIERVPDAVVGAGTVVSVAQLEEVAELGARFVVTPGLSVDICRAGQRLGVPVLPGVFTPSELMLGLSLGLDTFKLFPAAQAGGVGMLKALSGPFPTARFCPTGGIDFTNAPEYLALPNVLCVGMSSVLPSEAIARKDFAAISALAQKAAGFRVR